MSLAHSQRLSKQAVELVETCELYFANKCMGCQQFTLRCRPYMQQTVDPYETCAGKIMLHDISSCQRLMIVISVQDGLQRRLTIQRCPPTGL